MKTVIFIILSIFVLKISMEKITKPVKLDKNLIVKLDNGESKIVGGSPAGFGSIPWQGFFIRFVSNELYYSCGCSVINAHWVVTAAHCTDGTDASLMYIYLGFNKLSTLEYTGDEYTVARVVDHPDYNDTSFLNDISLLQLSKQIQMKEEVQPIALPQQGQTVSAGTLCQISGWGRTRDGVEEISDVLQYANVPIVSDDQCRDWYYPHLGDSFPHNSHICAGYESGGISVCQGDSGGPLACKDTNDEYVLHGVTSFGIGCAWPRKPAVYARVSQYVDWINNHLGLEEEGSGIGVTTQVINTTSGCHKTPFNALLFAVLMFIINIVI